MSHSEPQFTSLSFSNDTNGNDDGNGESPSDTIQILHDRLIENERLCESLQDDLEEKNAQIAALREELNEARDGQAEAENDAAANWEAKYLRLRGILRRSE